MVRKKTRSELMTILREGGTLDQGLSKTRAAALQKKLKSIGVKTRVIREKPVRPDKPTPDPEPDSDSDSSDDPEPAGENGNLWRVHGFVRTESEKPAAGWMVRLYDRDLQMEEFLGEAETGPKGDYLIQYHPDAFGSNEKGGPDLVVRIFSPDGVEHSARAAERELVSIGEDQILFHAEPEENLDWKLEEGTAERSRYEKVDSMLEPLLGERSAGDLGLEQWQFLHHETDLEMMWVVIWSEDARLASETGMPTGVFFGLGMQGVGIEEQSEGPARMNLPSVARHPMGVLQEALESALKDRQIPASLREEWDEILRLLERVRQLHGDKHPEVRSERLSGAARMSGLSEAKRKKLLERFRESDGGEDTNVTVRTLLREEVLDETEASRMAVSLEVGRLSGWNEKLVDAALQSKPAGRSVETLRDLARLSREEWQTMIEDSSEETSAPDPEIVANGVIRELSTRFPTARLHQRVRERLASDESGKGSKRLKRIEQLLEARPDVELQEVNFFAREDEKGAFDLSMVEESDRPVLRREAMACHRTLHLASDPDMAGQLLAAEMDTTARILSVTPDQLAKRTGIAVDRAQRIYRRAESLSMASRQLSMQLTVDHQETRSEPRAMQSAPEQEVEWKRLDGYEELFGRQSYCSCRHCASIFGPLAYYTDLMRFTDKHVIEPYFGSGVPEPGISTHLRSRRPDLWELELDCDSATELVPTLAIVNEVLERQVTVDLQDSDSDRRTVAYERLEQATNSFRLPFHRPLSELRVYLDQRSVQLFGLVEDLLPGSPRSVEEQLSLSPVEARQITEQRLDVSDLKTLFRLNDDESLDRIPMQAILDASRLNREDLEEVLSLSVVDPEGDLSMVRELIAGTTNRYEEFLIDAEPEILDRFHRFVRLMQATGWSSERLSDLVAHEADALFDPSADDEDREEALARVSGIHRLAERYELDPETLLMMIGRLPEHPVEPGEPSLFDRLFNEGLTPDDETWWEPDLSVSWTWNVASREASDSDGEAIYQRLLRASSLGEEPFQSLVTQLFVDPEDDSEEIEIELNLASLTRLIRASVRIGHFELAPARIDQLRELVESSESENADHPWGEIERALRLRTLLGRIGSSMEDLLEVLFQDDADEEEMTDQLLEELLPGEESVSFAMEHPELFGWQASTIRSFSVLESLLFYAGWARQEDRLEALHSVLLDGCRDPELVAVWLETSTSFADSLVNQLPLPESGSEEDVTTESVVRLARLESGAEAAVKLGVNGASISDLLSGSYDELDRVWRRVLAALRSSYEDEDRFLKEMRSSQDRIREKQRDALVDYLLSDSGNAFREIRDLYHHLLIDPEVAGCMDTSRVLQATQSVQLYLHRVMLGLETNDSNGEDAERIQPSREMRQEWEWRKEYRVWEANRKVFVYPENYLDPNVRTDKSPLFTKAEDKLVQQEITPETVETIYREYLEELQTVTSLTVTSGCYDKDRETYWFLGRGSGRSAPWYVRSASYVGPAAGWKSIFYDSKRPLDWSVWEEVDLKISAKSVSPFVWKDRLHLCWLEREEREKSVVVEGTPQSDGTEITQKLLVAWRRDSGGWSEPVEVELGRFHRSKYTRIDDYNNRIPYADWRVYPEIIDSKLYVEYLEWDDYDTESQVVEVDLFSATVEKDKSIDSSSLWGDTYFQIFDYNDSRNYYKLFGFKNEYEGDLRIEFPSEKNNGPVPIHQDLPDQLVWLTDDTRRNIFPYSKGAVTASFLHAIHGAPGATLLRLKDRVYFLEPNVNVLFILPLPYWRVWPMTNAHAGEMGSRLMREGIEAFLNDREEMEPESFPLSRPNEAMLQLQETMREGGTDRAYERELFLHLPRLIAQQLSLAGHYKEAQSWYHTLFDPTTDREPPTEQEIQNGVSPVAHYWTDPALRDSLLYPEELPLQSEEAIATYRAHPFEPHAIAGIRTRAYQKAIVMDYVGNLLDWADSLFARDTRESINEATLLYSLAAEVLGPRPTIQGDCASLERSDEPLTYDQLEIEGEFDVAMETLVLQSMQSQRVQVSDGSGGEENLLDDWDQMASMNLSGNTRELNVGGHLVNADGQDPEVRFGSGEQEARSSQLAASTVLPHSREAFCLPANEQMLGVWDRVEDRLFKIRNCMNIEGQTRSLALFAPPIDPAMMVRAAAAGLDLREIIGSGQGSIPVYRFPALVERAKQAASVVKGFGSALLSALEKKDAEELRQLQATHSKDLLNLNRELRERQIEMDRAALEALEKEKEMTTMRRDHYKNLVDNGLSAYEKAHLISMTAAQYYEVMGNNIRTAASIGYAVPQAGSPFAMTYGGQQLGAVLTALGGALGNMTSTLRYAATMSSTLGSHQRRKEGWEFQKKMADKELEKNDIRIRAANERIAMAERQMRIHEETVKQSDEKFDFYRSKFSNLGLYTWLASELGRLYHESFELALDLAQMAERAYHYEREDGSVFVTPDQWESQRAGLLAGERLSMQLRHMEKAYLDRNERTMELEQTLSLGQLDPTALASLREEGHTEFALPEVLFDLVYPGHYNRRIKSIRLTIPCLTGPYTNVNARLTLLESHIRPVAEPDESDESKLEPQPVAGRLSIATSSAQSDGGQFELNFRDERYLPYEGAGVVSRWKLEFPSGFRVFDYDTISDVLIHLSYTADEDESYRQEVEAGIGELLNGLADGDGYPRMISFAELHSSRWQQLLRSTEDDDGKISTSFPLDERHLPNFLRGRELEVSRIGFMIRINERWRSGLESIQAADWPVGVTLSEGDDGSARAVAELNSGGLEGLQTGDPAGLSTIEEGPFRLEGRQEWTISIQRDQLVALCEKLLDLEGEDADSFGSSDRMLSEMVDDLFLYLNVQTVQDDAS
ncbi:MAG: neuraminidase-like domain-containing protein [Bacteroidota bacterium]